MNNIDDCLIKRKEIEKEISKVFPSASIKDMKKESMLTINQEKVWYGIQLLN